jgi:signal peptidase II
MEKKYLIPFSTAIVVVFFDQLTKFLVRNNFELNQSISIINNIFNFTYIQNTGAGFGILKTQTAILVFISIAVLGVILYNFDKIKSKETLLQVLVGFVLGGTIGNLIDRIAYGYVIDFLDISIWPIFNFADSFVTMGVFGLIIYLWRK